MKKVLYLIKKSKWVVLSLLSIIGFSSCDTIQQKVEYGCPNADYTTKGSIFDEAGKPLKDIKITSTSGIKINDSTWYWNTYDMPTGKSDDKGNYSLTVSQYPPYSENKYVIKTVFEDIDGESNGGSFEKDSIIAGCKDSFTQISKQEGTWYMGEFELKKDMILKKK